MADQEIKSSNEIKKNRNFSRRFRFDNNGAKQIDIFRIENRVWDTIRSAKTISKKVEALGFEYLLIRNLKQYEDFMQTLY